MPFTAETNIQDVINDPSFEGCGQFLFPPLKTVDNLKLKELYRLLPHHSNVSIEASLDVLNTMQERFQDGSISYHSIYNGIDTHKHPRKKDVGLFFFRSKVDAKFGMICPGADFHYVGSIHEGFPIALELNKSGFAAFVLNYRTGSQQNAVEDLAAALAWIHEHASELNINPVSYSLWGGSAGARMVALVDSYGTAYFGGKVTPKAAAVILAYTGHEDVSKQESPTYVIVGDDDWISPPKLMKKRVQALQDEGIEVQFKVVAGVAHGFGLGLRTAAEGWVNEAIAFWMKHSGK